MKNFALFIALCFLAACSHPAPQPTAGKTITVEITRTDTVYVTRPAQYVYRTKYVPIETVAAWDWTEKTAAEPLSEAAPGGGDEKLLNVTPGMVKQKSRGEQTAGRLFDGNTQSAWFTGWAPGNYPAIAMVDFGAVVNITKIRAYDGTGQPTLTFSAAVDTLAPFALASLTMDLWSKWKEVKTSAAARYVYITLPDPQGESPVTEIEFYGTGETTTPPPPQVDTPPVSPPVIVTPPTTPPATGGTYTGEAGRIGTNGFWWIPDSILTPFAYVRPYGGTQWILDPKGKFWPNPTRQANGNIDAYLARQKAAGRQVVFCFNETPNYWPAWQHIPEAVRKHYPPIDAPGMNPEDPMSYKTMARLAFNFTARYGERQHDAQALSVSNEELYPNAPVNEPKSGLNYVDILEMFENETDRPWLKEPERWNPRILAAYLSAIRDGHRGAMGPGYGMKDGSPEVLALFPALSCLDTSYFGAVVQRSREIRGGSISWDINNFHHYSNKLNRDDSPYIQLFGGPTGIGAGINPEADNFYNKIRVTVDYCRRITPGTPFWLTEYGYDTHPGSPQTAGNERTAADWIQRQHLLARAAGVAVTFVYNGIDEPNPVGLYASSGVATGENAGFKKKAAWFMFSEMSAELRGMDFLADLSTADAGLLLFKAKDGKQKLVGWLFSATGQTKTVKFLNCDLILSERAKFFPVN
jgi:hypothetical protein